MSRSSHNQTCTDSQPLFEAKTHQRQTLIRFCPEETAGVGVGLGAGVDNGKNEVVPDKTSKMANAVHGWAGQGQGRVGKSRYRGHVGSR